MGDSDTPSNKASVLVEEVPQILHLLGEILHRNGSRPIKAQKPSEAIDTANHMQEHIDLLSTDAGLPGINATKLSEHAWRVRPTRAHKLLLRNPK